MPSDMSTENPKPEQAPFLGRTSVEDVVGAEQSSFDPAAPRHSRVVTWAGPLSRIKREGMHNKISSESDLASKAAQVQGRTRSMLHMVWSEFNASLPSLAMAGGFEVRTVVEKVSSPSVSTAQRRKKSARGVPQGASLGATVINLCNCMLGASILSAPSALASAGWLVGVILLVVVACMSLLAQRFCTLLCKYTGVFTFKEIFVAVLGNSWSKVLDFLLFMYSFLLLVAYIVILRNALGEGLLIAVSFLCLLPLSVLKGLEKLKVTSALAVFFILYLCFSVAATAVFSSDVVWQVPAVVPSVQSGLYTVSIWAFCLSACLNVPRLYGELRNRTVVQMAKVSVRATILNTVLYLIVALASVALMPNVSGNVLASLGNAWQFRIARIGMSVVIVTSFPLFSTIGVNYFLLGRKGAEKYRVRFGVAIAIVGCAYAVSFLANDLGTITSLLGATLGSAFNFTLPGGMALFFSRRMRQEGVIGRWGVVGMWLLLSGGILLFIYGVLRNLI